MPTTAKRKADAKSKAKSKSKKPTLAQRADKYVLYQHSVQEPVHEVEFFDRVYRETFGRMPRVLHEDFCGTFAVCCEWVKRGPKRVAIGVDLDPEPLDWGRANNLTQVPTRRREHVTLVQEDVRTVIDDKADVLAAQNFSFFCFTTRAQVTEYYRAAWQNLDEQGMFVIDMMGGGECFEQGHKDIKTVKTVDKPIGKFKYVWEHFAFNPITHASHFRINFHFRDGSKLEPAFEYHWRFWTIPEIREMLIDAGFDRTEVFWEVDDDDEDEGEDEDDEDARAESEEDAAPDAEESSADDWQRAEDAWPDPAWIAYVVGIKDPSK